jgi:transcriptional regulator with XRE-family HTH domain
MQADAVQGPYRSLGAVRLSEEMKARGLSAADVGRAVKTGRHVVCRWLSGQRRAALSYAVRLEALYGVAVADWTKSPPKIRRRR